MIAEELRGGSLIVSTVLLKHSLDASVENMAEHNVEAHRVTKPIQLLAAWLVGLFIIDGLFLTTAKLVDQPNWLAPLLVIAAVVNVPLFLICIFVLQTRFRPEMQEDAFYSTYIQAQLTTQKEVGAAHSQLELAETKDELASLEENYQDTLQTLNIEASQRKQLEQDYEILKQTNQAVAMRTLLHDLTTRLQSVVSEAENLATRVAEDTTTKHEIARDADRVVRSALVLSTALENYRYSEADASKVSRVDVAKLVTRSVEGYMAMAERKALTVRLDLEPVSGGSPTIRASPNQLQLAFNNIIDNAIRFSFRGSKESPAVIQITGKASGEYYKVMVENTGVGIAIDESLHIFQAGYVGRGALAESGSRPGWGLFITRQVIQRHGGDITIESHPIDNRIHLEGGAYLTRVTVTLPYAQPSESIRDA